jgi:hypothetical protein
MCTRLDKRPCRSCGKWFWPDPRIGQRQRTCTAEECQRKRRAKTQAAWRRANPEYAIAYRLQQRAAVPEREPSEARHPPPLDRLPWDLAKDEFKAQGRDFLEVLARVLLAGMKDEIREQAAVITREFRGQPPWAPKDQTGVEAV